MLTFSNTIFYYCLEQGGRSCASGTWWKVWTRTKILKLGKNYLFVAILVIRKKNVFLSQISKYASDERIEGIFALAESLPTSATLVRTETCSKNKGSGGFGKLKLKPTHPGQSRWTRGEIGHWRLALCGSDHWRDSYQRRRPAGESYFWEVSDNTSSSSSSPSSSSSSSSPLSSSSLNPMTRFPATRHRVVVPEQEFRRRSARQSIAFFVHPDDQVGM